MDAGLIGRFAAIVGPRHALTDPAETEPFATERRGLWPGATPLVLRPGSVSEVAAILRLASETATPIVPQGGNTGLTGGGQPHAGGLEVVVSTARMNRIRAVDTLNDTMTVEAGVVLTTIQDRAAEIDRLFPLSLGAEGSCQIGGNLSTNAGGTQVLRYGNARNLVLGLEVVLPDGRVWNGLRGLRKDNTGFDMKQLFIGGEGTIGIITAAVLRLFEEEEIAADLFLPTRMYPFEIDHLAESLETTRRLIVVEEGQGFAGLGSEVLAQVSERLGHLGVHCRRLSAAPVPIPAARPLEEKCLPGTDAIFERVMEVMGAFVG